jgi:hypothetical protein
MLTTAFHGFPGENGCLWSVSIMDHVGYRPFDDGEVHIVLKDDASYNQLDEIFYKPTTPER